MAELSPAAKAVLDAAEARWLDVDDDIPAQVAIAALRAAADNLTPKTLNAVRILYALIDIADELENHQ